MTSQIFCYHCVEYMKLDNCAKFHDQRSNNNKVMMGEPCPPPITDGSKKPMSNRVKEDISVFMVTMSSLAFAGLDLSLRSPDKHYPMTCQLLVFLHLIFVISCLNLCLISSIFLLTIVKLESSLNHFAYCLVAQTRSSE